MDVLPTFLVADPADVLELTDLWARLQEEQRIPPCYWFLLVTPPGPDD